MRRAERDVWAGRRRNPSGNEDTLTASCAKLTKTAFPALLRTSARTPTAGSAVRTMPVASPPNHAARHIPSAPHDTPRFHADNNHRDPQRPRRPTTTAGTHNAGFRRGQPEGRRTEAGPVARSAMLPAAASFPRNTSTPQRLYTTAALHHSGSTPQRLYTAPIDAGNNSSAQSAHRALHDPDGPHCVRTRPYGGDGKRW